MSQYFYNSARSLSVFTIAGLGALAAIDLASVVIGFGSIMGPASALDLGDGDSTSIWLLLQGLVALLKMPAYIFTVVVFLIWLNRVFKNLPALRSQTQEFSPGWAVGWWFIPFFNLVKPFQVVREAWRESDPDFDPDASFLSGMSGAPAFMGFWWAFWLLSNLFSNIASQVYDPENIATVTASGYLFIISGILTIIAAALAIKVVREITQRQELRYGKFGPRREYDPPPPNFEAAY